MDITGRPQGAFRVIIYRTTSSTGIRTCPIEPHFPYTLIVVRTTITVYQTTYKQCISHIK